MLQNPLEDSLEINQEEIRAPRGKKFDRFAESFARVPGFCVALAQAELESQSYQWPWSI